jgi:hypothetical protein
MFERRYEGPEPVSARPAARRAGAHEDRVACAGRLASGTLACPRCDAPVLPARGRISPAEWLGCPYCLHAAPARDFLSLAAPSRPARVAVLVRQPAVAARG